MLTQSIRHSFKVVDPIRRAAGFFGTTFHDSREDAEERVAMFPGSVIEEIEEIIDELRVEALALDFNAQVRS